MRLYKKCIAIYDHYRKIIPPYAPAALSFYLLLILIPACSLLAVGTSLFHIDMTIIETLINRYVMSDYASMLIEVLESRSIDTMALVTIVFSFYAVSRGVGNIYEISKNMYPENKTESILSYYIYTFKITFFLLLLFIGIVGVMAIGPLAHLFNVIFPMFGMRHIFLYCMIVFCLMSIYMIVPRRRIRYRDAIRGAMGAGLLLMILYYVLNIYFRFADFQSVYGPLAFIIVVLFVFDWSAEIFYIGMYVTYILDQRRRMNEKRNIRY